MHTQDTHTNAHTCVRICVCVLHTKCVHGTLDSFRKELYFRGALFVREQIIYPVNRASSPHNQKR